MDLATNYMGLGFATRSSRPPRRSRTPSTASGGSRTRASAPSCSPRCSRSSCERGRGCRLSGRRSDSFAEALGFFPAVARRTSRSASLSEPARARRAAVDVPVIASLNGVTPEGWTDYARAMQDAGAAAIELNIYYLPGDPQTSGRDVEQRHVDVLERVKHAVTMPVAVKLGPHFSSTGEIALRLDAAGADALVLFNRSLHPDIHPESLAVVPDVVLSSPAEARLPRMWIALLRGWVRASLAATTGVETAADVAAFLLAGADVVMIASALLAMALSTRRAARRPARGWRARASSARRLPRHALRSARHRPAGYERAGYVSALRAANIGAYAPGEALAGRAVHHLRQRHAVPTDRARGGDAARAAGLRD